MKVLFIASYSGVMGANLSMLQLMIELKKRGVSPCLLIPDRGLLYSKLEENEIPFVVSKYMLSLGANNSAKGYIKSFIRSLLNLFLYPIALVKVLVKFGVPDVIHSNTSVIHIGEFFNLILRKPHIHHLREFGFEDYGMTYWLGNRIHSWFCNTFSNFSIAISGSIKNHFENLGFKNVVLIYNGISDDRVFRNQSPVNTEDINILCMGVLNEQKNQFQVVKAVVPILNNNPRCHVYFLGPDNSKYAGEIKKFIIDQKLSSNIHLCGMQMDVSHYMQDATIAIVPSKNEAFGRVTIEYMLNQIPVIVSNQGGNLELVKDGVTGLIYNIEDTNDLTKKLLDLLNNRSLREQLASNAYKNACNNFTASVNANNIRDLYNKLI